MTAGHRRSTKLRGGWETTTPQAATVIPSRGLTGVQTPCPTAARKVRIGTSRSSSAESQLCLLLVPALFCTRKRAACLLQTASAIFLKGPLPFPVPEQFSPVAGDTLQT